MNSGITLKAAPSAAHSPGFRWLAILLALPFLFVVGSPTSSQGQINRSSTSDEPINVGMVALLAAPERYEGKLVRTHGFLCIEFEGDALYLHEEDYRYGLTKDSFALRLTESQRKQFKSLSLKYVVIEGRVYANGLERGDWGGAIGNITRLNVWPVDRLPAQHQ
jgi:hypothetical protein